MSTTRNVVWVLSQGEAYEGHDPQAVFTSMDLAKAWAKGCWPGHTEWWQSAEDEWRCYERPNTLCDELFLTEFVLDRPLPPWATETASQEES